MVAAAAAKSLDAAWFPQRDSMGNLFVEMMGRLGVPLAHFGDSTGKQQGLDLS
jgi:hypothetical protein